MENNVETRIADLSEILNGKSEDTTVIDWCDQKLSIRRFLPLPTAVMLVNAVVESCFSEDTGEYIPEMRFFAEKIATIAAYTNVDIPENNELQYQLIYQTDIMKCIETYADKSQYNDIMCAIEDGLRTRKNSNLAEFKNEVQRMTDQVTALISNITSAFGDISQDDLSAFVKAVISGEVNDGKILEAVIKKEEKDNG